jgi:hypothetical protein
MLASYVTPNSTSPVVVQRQRPALSFAFPRHSHASRRVCIAPVSVEAFHSPLTRHETLPTPPPPPTLLLPLPPLLLPQPSPPPPPPIPTTTPSKHPLSYGATPIVHGAVWDDANKRAKEEADLTGAELVHPFDCPHVWKGNSTLVHELVRFCCAQTRCHQSR